MLTQADKDATYEKFFGHLVAKELDDAHFWQQLADGILTFGAKGAGMGVVGYMIAKRASAYYRKPVITDYRLSPIASWVKNAPIIDKYFQTSSPFFCMDEIFRYKLSARGNK